MKVRREKRPAVENREQERRGNPVRRRNAVRAAILFLPGALVVVGAAGLRAAGLGEGGAFSSLPVWAAVAWGSGLFIAARFRRWRLVLGLAHLALLQGLVLWLSPGGWDLPGPGRVVFALSAIALPLNLPLWALLPERAPWVGRGVWVWAVPFLLEVVTIAFFVRFAELGAGTVLAGPATPCLPLPGGMLPWPAALAGALGAAGLGILALKRRSPVEAALAWAQVASGLAFAQGRPTEAFTFYLAAASLVLALGAVEGSRVLAYRDALTGLPGRRHLMEELQSLTGRYAVAMVDVDHFKDFNDRYGHAAGDQALRRIASRLETVEGGGRAYRYGGEEFVLLFPGAPAKGALPHLEAVREALAAETFVVRGKERRAAKRAARGEGSPGLDVRVTASIGLAEGKAGDDPEEVLRMADHALYRAKEGGRNRVAR